jgi:hypothetical protein
MVYATTTTFFYNGTPTATINSLTSKPASTLTLSNLVVDTNKLEGNLTNQEVFMNQPMFWWVTQLSSKAIKYRPISNNVNWIYTSSAGQVYNINKSVTDILLPSKTESSSMNPDTRLVAIKFVPKFGMCRTDTVTM